MAVLTLSAPAADVHGLSAVAFYSTAPGDIVQLNALGEGSEVSVRMPIDADGMTSPTGGRYFGGDHSRLVVESLDWDAYPVLEQWMRDGREVSAAGYGPTGALLWHEADPITVRPQAVKGASGGARGFTVELQRKGHSPHRIYWNSSLIDHIGWGGAGAAVPPVGYTQSGGGGGYWENEFEYSMGAVGAGASLVGPQVVFPVVGAPLVLSVGTQVFDGQQPPPELRLRVLNRLGGVLGEYAAGWSPNAAVGGRQRLSVVTPPGTGRVQPVLYAYQGVPTNEPWLSFPALRVAVPGSPPPVYPGRVGPPRP